jgi:hypothetical protein
MSSRRTLGLNKCSKYWHPISAISAGSLVQLLTSYCPVALYPGRLRTIPWTTFILFWSFNNLFRRKWRAARFATICALNLALNEIFDEVMDIWKISSLYGDCRRNQICHDKTTFWLKTDPGNKFLNPENRLIVFSSSSSTHRHTSTSSYYNIIL